MIEAAGDRDYKSRRGCRLGGGRVTAPNSNGSHCQFTSRYIVTTYKFKWQVTRCKDSRYAALDPGIIGHKILYHGVLCPESGLPLPESRHVLNLPFECCSPCPLVQPKICLWRLDSRARMIFPYGSTAQRVMLILSGSPPACRMRPST